MSTFYVKKNGSGTHTTIQSAFVQAVSGDIIEVEAGLFEENVDFYKSGITLKGAGKNLTEIRGVLDSSVTKACTFTSGSTTISIPAGTTGFKVGRFIQGTGLAATTRIVSVSATSITISIATTSARTNQNVVMPAIPSTVVVRGTNHKIKDLKITAVQALESRCLADNAAIFFRNTGNGEVPANGYILEDCIIEARGESAIMTDAASTIGSGIIRNNIVQGKTFVGASAAQVSAFGTMTKTGTVLSARTIQFSDLSGITAPHAGNSQGSEITPGLRVSAINGNIVTVTANITDAVGTSRSFSFGNVQFNFPNVPRQLVVIQGVNSATQFLNNTVNGVTGSGITYNTAVTVDAPSSTITGNTMNGEFKYGFALRARGANSTVSSNINYSFPGNENAGYLIGPNGPTQLFGMNVGTNSSITAELVSVEQTAGESFVTFEMSKEVLKQNSAVSSHAVFSNEANWNMVSYVFKHNSSARRLVGSFKDFSSPKSSKLKPNMAVGDRFELHKIILATSPRDLLVLKRSQISGASGFDFNLVSDGPEESNGGGGSNKTPIVYDLISGNAPTLEADGGVSGGIPGDENFVKSSLYQASGDFTFEWDFDWSTFEGNNTLVGITNNSSLSIHSWYSGLTCIETRGPGSVRYWFNGSPQSPVALSSGAHKLKISRSGSTVSIYLDNVLVQDISGYTQTCLPTVRTMGLQACTKSEVSNGPGESNGGGGGSQPEWNFARTSTYFANANGEITSSYAQLGSGVTSLLFSQNAYTVGNGLEIQYVVSAETFNSGFAFMGVQGAYGDPIFEENQYSGFYRDFAPFQVGVRNQLGNPIGNPGGELTLKIKVFTTHTEFYVNGSMVNMSFGPASSQYVYLAVRVSSSGLLKSATVTQL